MHTNTLFTLASEHGANLDPLHSGDFDSLGLDFVNFLVCTNKQFFWALGINKVIARMPTHEPFAEFDHFVFAFVDRLNPNTVSSSAIILTNDNVLGNVHEFACHVPRVGRL